VGFLALGVRRRVRFYETFVDGAKEGFTVAVGIIPYLVAMLVAVGVLRASGALDQALDAVRWAVAGLGMDGRWVDALPVALVRPLSGSGARGLVIETMKTLGPDSFAGRLACVIQGSTETTFYVLAVYFGSVGIRNTRHAIACGLTAELAGFLGAVAVSYLSSGRFRGPRSGGSDEAATRNGSGGRPAAGRRRNALGRPPAAAFVDLFNGKDLTGWVNVNTDPGTWSARDGQLVCSGRPIGVMRSEKQYENFVLHVEWMHVEPGGNSGVFIWSNARPGESRLPDGVEVQMLELDWVKLNARDGKCRRSPTSTVSSSASAASRSCPTTPGRAQHVGREPLPGARRVEYLRCRRRGRRRQALRQREVRERGQPLDPEEGYLCLESEGAEIHFRNIRILELPPGVTTPDQVAPILQGR